MYADMHVHTNHSDGIYEISDVLKMAKDEGIKAIAITDHDTVDQFQEIKDIGNELHIEVVKGVEISCYDYDVNKKVHIVGLWLNDETPHVEEVCQKALEFRDNYNKETIRLLKVKGYEITYEDAKKYSKYNIVFKMNIFQALKDKYPKDRTKEIYHELFECRMSRKIDMKMGYPSVNDGIQAIREDGSIVILAHPCVYNNYGEIEKYIGYGLQGIEINHSKMNEIDYVKTREIADKYNLLKSGGCDFHDDVIKFGRFGLDKEQYDELKSSAQLIEERLR